MLYVLLDTQTLVITHNAEPALDSHGHVALDSHGRPALASTPGVVTRGYITDNRERVVAVHNFNPQPQQCRVMEPES